MTTTATSKTPAKRSRRASSPKAETVAPTSKTSVYEDQVAARNEGTEPGLPVQARARGMRATATRCFRRSVGGYLGAAVVNFTVASAPRRFDRQSKEWKVGPSLGSVRK